MDEKKQRIGYRILIAVYVVILVLVGKGFAERAMVKAGAVASLEVIKQGLPDDLLDQIVDEFLTESIENNTIRALLRKALNGENINDIYDALLYRMSYDVEAVEKVGPGDYRVNILVRNNNNIIVGKTALELLKKRYENDYTKIFDDLKDDKSQLIKNVLIAAADLLAQQQTPGLYSEQSYIISVGSDGHIIFENQNDINFVLLCAGIPIGSAPSGEITDEYTIYMVMMVILVAIPVVVLFLKRKKKTNGALINIPENDEINKPHPDIESKENIPVLYAQTPQHNNMPFAVHEVPIYIGRDPSCCKIVFKEGTTGISGRHCCLRFDSGIQTFELTDLGSTYGTYLANGEKIVPNKPYLLSSGESFYIGDRLNMFRVELK